MRNYSIYTLKTKLEFTNLYQYLSEKDYKQLEQQILCYSYHTPICTWNGIVINGIEAYELFRKHSIPFRIKRGSITNFVGFPIPLVALSAHIE